MLTLSHLHQLFSMSWLRVSCRADASRMGQGGREESHTKAVPSEKYGVVRGTTSARHAPNRHGVWPTGSRDTDRKTTYVLRLLLWPAEMSKARNQFVVKSTAFEAVLLIKPPALPGVSDCRIRPASILHRP
jgi:hypothetical protein